MKRTGKNDSEAADFEEQGRKTNLGGSNQKRAEPPLGGKT
jgi:hypothetical protein